jgi:flagellar biosynthesis/type III secretory pathway M-ring protein FliF/YscJ
MNTDLWVYIIVFVVVFTVVSVVLVKRESKAEKDLPDRDYEEIRAEVFEAEKEIAQSRVESDLARKAQMEAEKLQRKTFEELEKAKTKVPFKKRGEKPE